MRQEVFQLSACNSVFSGIGQCNLNTRVRQRAITTASSAVRCLGAIGDWIIVFTRQHYRVIQIGIAVGNNAAFNTQRTTNLVDPLRHRREYLHIAAIDNVVVKG